MDFVVTFSTKDRPLISKEELREGTFDVPVYLNHLQGVFDRISYESEAKAKAVNE